jgi:hypothetical protein
MKRPAAEKAVSELDGLNWGGSVIRVAFGNVVRIPARPIYGDYDPVRFVIDADADAQILETRGERGVDHPRPRGVSEGIQIDHIRRRRQASDLVPARTRDHHPHHRGDPQPKTDGWPRYRLIKRILCAQSLILSKIMVRGMKRI